MDASRKEIYIAVIVLIILAGLVIAYQTIKSAGVDQAAADRITATDEEIEGLNPFKEATTTNPFDQKTNPYERVKINPFE